MNINNGNFSDYLTSSESQIRRAGGDKKKSNDDIRRGKWTDEEERYARKLIEAFNAGLLRISGKDVSSGLTLRAFLAEKLCCDPMRITKKFSGDFSLGKRSYQYTDTTIPHHIIENVKKELEIYELQFREKDDEIKREKYNREMTEKNKLNPVIDFNQIISSPAIDAMVMQTFSVKKTNVEAADKIENNSIISAIAKQQQLLQQHHQQNGSQFLQSQNDHYNNTPIPAASLSILKTSTDGPEVNTKEEVVSAVIGSANHLITSHPSIPCDSFLQTGNKYLQKDFMVSQSYKQADQYLPLTAQNQTMSMQVQQHQQHPLPLPHLPFTASMPVKVMHSTSPMEEETNTSSDNLKENNNQNNSNNHKINPNTTATTTNNNHNIAISSVNNINTSIGSHSPSNYITTSSVISMSNLATMPSFRFSSSSSLVDFYSSGFNFSCSSLNGYGLPVDNDEEDGDANLNNLAKSMNRSASLQDIAVSGNEDGGNTSTSGASGHSSSSNVGASTSSSMYIQALSHSRMKRNRSYNGNERDWRKLRRNASASLLIKIEGSEDSSKLRGMRKSYSCSFILSDMEQRVKGVNQSAASMIRSRSHCFSNGNAHAIDSLANSGRPLETIFANRMESDDPWSSKNDLSAAICI